MVDIKKVSLSANFYRTLSIPTMSIGNTYFIWISGDYTSFIDVQDPFNMLSVQDIVDVTAPSDSTRSVTTVTIPFSRRYSVTTSCTGQQVVLSSNHTPTVYTQFDACLFYVQAIVYRNGVAVEILGDSQAASEEQWGHIKGFLYPSVTNSGNVGNGLRGLNGRIKSNLDLYAGDKIQFRVIYTNITSWTGGPTFTIQGSPKFTIEINELTDI